MTPIRILTFCLTATMLAATAAMPAAADEAANAALRAEAYATCKGRDYPHDTKVVINYAKGWFRCEWPKEYKGNGKRK